MFKKIFWVILFIGVSWWIYHQYKVMKEKKRIASNPGLNESVNDEAQRTGITYSQQLNKTARFIVNNS